MDNINITEKGAAFASAREIPWHRLGKILPERMTTKEALEYALLDYKVEKLPLYAKYVTEDGQVDYIEIPKSRATARVDTKIPTPFGIVSNTYQIYQNKEALQFIDNIVEEGEGVIETAGALKKGETIFITVKLPQQILNVAGYEDKLEQYLLITNSHNAKRSIQVLFTPIRVVCNNTLNIALVKARNKYSVRHSGNVVEKMEEVAYIMRLHKEYQRQFIIDVNKETHLFPTDFSVQTLKKIMYSTKKVSDVKDIKLSLTQLRDLRGVLEYYNEGIGQQSIPHSPYKLLNAITGYYQNVKNYTSSESKFNQITNGKVNSLLQQSYTNLIFNGTN